MLHDLEDRLQQISGIDPKLARRILRDLDSEDVETLRMAVESGRVEEVPGVGAETVQRLREDFAIDPAKKEPPARMLLDVDEQHRAQARAGELPTTAPKRNNPSGEAWLPILKTKRYGHHFTALFSFR